MKKVIIFIILIVIGIFAFFFCRNMKEEKLTDILKNVEKEFVIDDYFIFGTHFNISGCTDESLESIELVLKNKDEEIVLNSNIKKETDKTCFYTSEQLNAGIYLDDLNIGDYLLLVKNGEEYYSLKNDTDFNNLEYYTVTRENKNNKIEILFDKEDEKDYVEFVIRESKLPDNVYDIAIDPGHGGKDVGALASLNGTEYHEADFTLEISKLLKKKLEQYGLKVKLTRDGDTYLSNYDKGGRALIPNDFNTKYSFSLHLNSSTGNQKYGGVEVYTPNDIDLSLAKLIAKNLAYEVNYSKKEMDRISDGVYFTSFSEKDIETSKKRMLDNDMEPYDIKVGAASLFMIREVGGIKTYAYVDGRNDYYGLNKYYNSNKVAEPYLIEMAYMNYDLKKIINNQEEFADALNNAITEFLNVS